LRKLTAGMAVLSRTVAITMAAVACLVGGLPVLLGLVALLAASASVLLVVAALGTVLIAGAFAPAMSIGLALFLVSMSPRIGRSLARGMHPRRDVRRALAILGGVTAVLIPTLFTLFPAWGLNWRPRAKLGILAGWLVAALLVVWGTIRTSELLEGLDEKQRERLRRGRTSAERLLIQAWLAPSNTGLGPDYAPQLFVPDRWGTRLVPLFDPGGWGPEDGWTIASEPHPVTVEAWMTNNYAHVKGQAVGSAQYGLNSQQQRRYAVLTGVAASPIQDASGRQLGVLVFLTRMPAEQSRIGELGFIQLHVALAEVLAHVLVNIGGILGED
jgi:MFS family permease